LRAVAISSLQEDELLKILLDSKKHNLKNIPIADNSEVLDLELGLVLKTIIKVVRCYLHSSSIRSHKTAAVEKFTILVR